MTTFGCIFPTLLVLAALFVVRAVIVFKCDLKAIDIAFAYKDWRAGKKKLDANDEYLSKILDLRKWTYSQFYPDLPKEQS